MTLSNDNASQTFSSANVDFFFQSPAGESSPATVQRLSTYSTLYALRRDIDFCLQVDRRSGKPLIASFRALWPGAMTILAGIDLLAKFYKGSDEHESGKGGGRFKAFLVEFLGVNRSEREILYKLRNTLGNSFGVPCDVEGTFVDLAFAQYQLLVSPTGPDRKVVDLWMLYLQFEKGIAAYRDALNSDTELQENFARMFAQYGSFNAYATPQATVAA